MSGNYPEPEVWPDDDRDYELSRDELAREELDSEEQRAYFQRWLGKRRRIW